MIEDGAIWAHDGQVFECIAVKPYVRRDGVEVGLAVIGSLCVDCGSPYLTKSSVQATQDRITRRCVDHRRPGKSVQRRHAA